MSSVLPAMSPTVVLIWQRATRMRGSYAPPIRRTAQAADRGVGS
jgi:hypothetical protein